MDRRVHTCADADVILNRGHESRENDLNRVQTGTKPLTNKDSIFVGKQLDSPAAGKFWRQPYAGAHLGVTGRVGDNPC